MTWERGQETIIRLLEAGKLARVTPSGLLAERLMDEAAAHLSSALTIAELDSTGAYQLAYDAARKACNALLAVQGLRSTSRGGHVAVQDAAREQFGGVFRHFGTMRRRRQGGEYPGDGTPTITQADAAEGIEGAGQMIDAARKLLDSDQLTPL